MENILINVVVSFCNLIMIHLWFTIMNLWFLSLVHFCPQLMWFVRF